MCNIAGYVGTKPAAPILIDMMLREEGFAGGYYSGIATIHEGNIYYAKLTGDVRRLTALTDAAKLPGTVGIIHSRSNSGGGDEWAHPFVSEIGGNIRTAYVANGSVGCFTSGRDAANKLAEQLIAEGFDMHSRIRFNGNRYNRLHDGTSVHMSDVMCQLITKGILGGKAVPDAMTDAFCEMPSEIVGLMLSLTAPDRIAWSRINMPMSVGFANHGAYLASTAIAFPDDASDPVLLPSCASGDVTCNGFTAKVYKNPPTDVAPLTARVRAEAYPLICSMLSEEEHPFSELRNAIKPLFDSADCVPAAQTAYEVLYSLYRQGRLCITEKRVDGAVAGVDAPKYFLRLL